jgi:signal recognition particle subunit SRP54
MFESLTDRLQDVFRSLARRGKLRPEDVDRSLRDIRLALLEADVNYQVVRELVERVRERAVGAEVSAALNPAQQVIKILNEELQRSLGDGAPRTEAARNHAGWAAGFGQDHNGRQTRQMAALSG